MASQLVALSLRIGYHDALTGVPLNVARHVDKAAARVVGDGDAWGGGDAYARPRGGGRGFSVDASRISNPLLRRLAAAFAPPPLADSDSDDGAASVAETIDGTPAPSIVGTELTTPLVSPPPESPGGDAEDGFT